MLRRKRFPRPFQDERVGRICVYTADHEPDETKPLMLALAKDELVYVIAKEDHNWALVRRGSEVGIAAWKSLRISQSKYLPFEQEIELPEFRGVYGKCGPCGSIFENVVMYTYHVKTFPYMECAKAFRCTKCQLSFITKESLDKHVCNIERLNRNCPLCGKRYTRRMFMRTHYKKHKKVPNCKTCGTECIACREMRFNDMHTDVSGDDTDEASDNEEDATEQHDGEPTAAEEDATEPTAAEEDATEPTAAEEDATEQHDEEPAAAAAAAVSNWNSYKGITRIHTLNQQLVEANVDLMNKIINKTLTHRMFMVIRSISLRKDLVPILDQTYYETLRNLFTVSNRNHRTSILDILEFLIVECNVGRRNVKVWISTLTNLKNDLRANLMDHHRKAERMLNALQQVQVGNEESTKIYPNNINTAIDRTCRTLIESVLLQFDSVHRNVELTKLRAILVAVQSHTNSPDKDQFEESLLRHGLLHVGEMIFSYRMHLQQIRKIPLSNRILFLSILLQLGYNQTFAYYLHKTNLKAQINDLACDATLVHLINERWMESSDRSTTPQVSAKRKKDGEETQNGPAESQSSKRRKGGKNAQDGPAKLRRSNRNKESRGLGGDQQDQSATEIEGGRGIESGSGEEDELFTEMYDDDIADPDFIHNSHADYQEDEDNSSTDHDAVDTSNQAPGSSTPARSSTGRKSKVGANLGTGKGDKSSTRGKNAAGHNSSIDHDAVPTLNQAPGSSTPAPSSTGRKSEVSANSGIGNGGKSGTLGKNAAGHNSSTGHDAVPTADKKMHICYVCDSKFSKKSLLKMHLHKHTGEKPFICDVCAKGFSERSSLYKHKLIHTGEKPFQCLTCGKSFRQSATLKKHMFSNNCNSNAIAA